jgi:hypothetical protein
MRAAAAAALAVLGALLASCGGGEERDARAIGRQTIAEAVAPPPEAEVGRRDVRAAPTALERAFLAHWRRLQQGRWAVAVARMSPRTLEELGSALVERAYRTQAAFLRVNRPRTGPAGALRLRFRLHREGHRVVPGSAYFESSPSGPRVLFDSILWEGLRFASAQGAQRASEAGRDRLSAAALRAAERATMVEAGYLEKLLRE